MEVKLYFAWFVELGTDSSSFHLWVDYWKIFPAIDPVDPTNPIVLEDLLVIG